MRLLSFIGVCLRPVLMRLIRILTAVGMMGAGLLLATPAQAGNPPVGSCPDGFAVVSASIQPSTDSNGDGLVCEEFLTPTDQPFGPGFAIVIDNKVQG
jgi:hypothetical protein